MTPAEAVTRCLTRTGTFAESDQTLTEDSLYEAIPDASRQFARMIRMGMDDGNRQKLVRTFTTSSLSSGSVSLSSLLSLSEPPLFIDIGSNGHVGPFQSVRHASLAYPLRFVTNRVNVILPVSLPSYAIEGNVLYTALPRRQPNLTGTLEIQSVFIPTPDSVPSELEEMYLETLVRTALRMRGNNGG